MSPLLFQISPDDAALRKRLHNHVLVALKGGTIYRGTLSAWSPVKQTLTLTNAQVEGAQLSGLGAACKTFQFHTISDVRVADASPEVLATLTPELQERAKATAASMARAAAEDARIESHRNMTELVDQADKAGISLSDLLIQRGLAAPVDDDDDDDEADAKAADEAKKKRRRGGKKHKTKLKTSALVEADPNFLAQVEAATEQVVAAAAQATPRARVILEFGPSDSSPPVAHILPAKTTRGNGRIHDFLLNGVGPILVGPVEHGLPSLDAEIQLDGARTTFRRMADKVLQDHEDRLEVMLQRMGLPMDGDARERIVRVMANAPPGASELDPSLARVIRGLEDGSMGIAFK